MPYVSPQKVHAHHAGSFPEIVDISRRRPVRMVEYREQPAKHPLISRALHILPRTVRPAAVLLSDRRCERQTALAESERCENAPKNKGNRTY